MRTVLPARILSVLALTGTALGAGAATLPQKITDAGEIRVAMTPNYPPMEFRDPASNRLKGFDIELGEAIGAKLGVKIDWTETTFSEMLSALKTGRVDMIMSGMTDLAKRHGSASFVDYLRSGPSFFVSADNAEQYPDISAVCGKKVGASRRTSYPDEIAAWSKAHCGGSPIVFVGTDGSADARTQLKQGRIEVAMQGNETLPYVMEQEPGTYHPVGKPIAWQFTGIALPVEETGFQQAVSEALDALIADGTYAGLLKKWHLEDDGVTKAEINGGK